MRILISFPFLFSAVENQHSYRKAKKKKGEKNKRLSERKPNENKTQKSTPFY